MVDWIHFATSVVSASVAVIAGLTFFVAYYRGERPRRLMWGLAFILYAMGHVINSWLVFNEIDITSPLGTTAMWVYVNLGGTGTVGLLLYATVPFVTSRRFARELVTALYVVPYAAGTTLFAFFLPGDTPWAFFNPETHLPVHNMSWWVVVDLVPFVLFIGLIFLRHFWVTGVDWALLIGASFVLYSAILFIWPVVELKPLFYSLRTISVMLLCIGGVILARE